MKEPKHSSKASVGKKEKQPKQRRYATWVRVVTSVGSAILALLGALSITASIFIISMFSGVTFHEDEVPYDPNADVQFEPDGEDENGGEEVDPDQFQSGDTLSSIAVRGNSKGVRNFLLLGIDGTGYSGRADTTMILSVNDNDKTIKLVSLQRDTFVSIPGRDKDGDGQDDIDKLAHAYAYGKHTLHMKMIEENFRLDIDEYIGVNFSTLPKVIDALGGLDIRLTAKEMTQIPDHGCNRAIPVPGKDCDGQMGFTSLKGEPGVHHLNGFQAMQYARIRKLDSDFKRTARQREVVELMIAKAKKMSYTQLVTVMNKALDCVSTNMTADEFLGFAADATRYLNYEIKTDLSVPLTKEEYKGVMLNGRSGLMLTDQKALVEKLHKYLYE